ncbi:hypothetical protein KSD_74540 [Ktedonobacter sp. SOSP1-85]|nr:hypothetical protein KSD_74540 [Ktedonobacter sp. SOSP1-85]
MLLHEHNIPQYGLIGDRFPKIGMMVVTIHTFQFYRHSIDQENSILQGDTSKSDMLRYHVVSYNFVRYYQKKIRSIYVQKQ